MNKKQVNIVVNVTNDHIRTAIEKIQEQLDLALENLDSHSPEENLRILKESLQAIGE